MTPETQAHVNRMMMAIRSRIEFSIELVEQDRTRHVSVKDLMTLEKDLTDVITKTSEEFAKNAK